MSRCGEFRATISDDDQSIDYALTFSGLQRTVTNRNMVVAVARCTAISQVKLQHGIETVSTAQGLSQPKRDFKCSLRR